VLTKRPEGMLEILSQPKFPILLNVWLGPVVN
jgi:protein gp37